MAKGSRLSSRPSIPSIVTGKRIIFTGPDGTGDYQPRLPDHTHYVGVTRSPVEGTSDTAYLWRPASYNLPPLWHRQCFVGEIGWGVYDSFDRRHHSWTKPIRLGQSPPPEEYEIINRFRNPRWEIHPAPDLQDMSCASFPNYLSMSIMARPEMPPCQVKT